jgi:hypothetical protein
VLTQQDGSKLYGVCRTVYLPLPPDAAAEVSAAWARAPAGMPFPPHQQLWAPVTISALTRVPYIGSFKELLSGFVDRSPFFSAPEGQYAPIVSGDVEAAVHACQSLLAAVSVDKPRPGASVRISATLSGPTVSIRCPRPSQLPVADTDFRALFSALSPASVAQLYELLLAERKVIFTAASLEFLTDAVLQASALLYPLEWPFVIISALPAVMVEAIDAPMPYLIGCSRATLQAAAPVAADCCVVDLDTATVSLPPMPPTGATADEDPVLPARLRARLIKALTAASHSLFATIHPGAPDDTPQASSRSHGSAPMSHSGPNAHTGLSGPNSASSPLSIGTPASAGETFASLLSLDSESSEGEDAVLLGVAEPRKPSSADTPALSSSAQTMSALCCEGSVFPIPSPLDAESEASSMSNSEDWRADMGGLGSELGMGGPATLPDAVPYSFNSPSAAPLRAALGSTGPSALSRSSGPSDSSMGRNGPSGPSKGYTLPEVDVVAVRMAFVNYLVHVLRPFWRHVHVTGHANEVQTLQCFDSVSFLADTQLDSRPWASHFVRTQLFERFVHERLCLDGKDLFQACLIALEARLSEERYRARNATVEGLLVKLGRRRHNWKTRFFQLKGTTLTYYTPRDPAAPIPTVIRDERGGSDLRAGIPSAPPASRHAGGQKGRIELVVGATEILIPTADPTGESVYTPASAAYPTRQDFEVGAGVSDSSLASTTTSAGSSAVLTSGTPSNSSAPSPTPDGTASPKLAGISPPGAGFATPFPFLVEVPGRTLLMCAPTERDRRLWVRLLEARTRTEDPAASARTSGDGRDFDINVVAGARVLEEVRRQRRTWNRRLGATYSRLFEAAEHPSNY